MSSFNQQPPAYSPELSRSSIIELAGMLAVSSCAQLAAATGQEWHSDPLPGALLRDETNVMGDNQLFVRRYRTAPTDTAPGLRVTVEDWPDPRHYDGSNIIIETYHYHINHSGRPALVVDECVRFHQSGYVTSHYRRAELHELLKPWHWTPYRLYDHFSLASEQSRGRQFLARVRPYFYSKLDDAS